MACFLVPAASNAEDATEMLHEMPTTGITMALLTTVFAAIIATIVWYVNDERKTYKIGFLSFMYWGASIMWLVDAIFEYVELGAEQYFGPLSVDMLNDFFLGLSVVAFGLIIWLIVLFISDPKKVVRKTLAEKMNEVRRCRFSNLKNC